MDTDLHIGTGKTGTSSLQVFLHKNRAVLAEQGVLYTKKLGETNNIEIAKYGLGFTEFGKSPFFQNLEIKNRVDKVGFDRNVAKKLKEEISDARGRGLKKAIISSEHFSTDLRKIENIEKIKLLFDCVGINVKNIILYIREQTSYIFSDYNTRVLMGLHEKNVPILPSSVTNSALNHSHTIKIWSDAFPDSKMRVRIFEKDKLHNGNTVDDFIFLAQLNNLNSFEYLQETNQSYSKEALEFLVKYNDFVRLNGLDHILGIARPEIKNFILPCCRKSFPGQTLKPTRKQKLAMRDLFKPSNEDVRVKYFPELDSLFAFDESEPEICQLKLEDGQMSLIVSLLIELLENK